NPVVSVDRPTTVRAVRSPAAVAQLWPLRPWSLLIWLVDAWAWAVPVELLSARRPPGHLPSPAPPRLPRPKWLLVPSLRPPVLLCLARQYSRRQVSRVQFPSLQARFRQRLSFRQPSLQPRPPHPPQY